MTNGKFEFSSILAVPVFEGQVASQLLQNRQANSQVAIATVEPHAGTSCFIPLDQPFRTR